MDYKIVVDGSYIENDTHSIVGVGGVIAENNNTIIKKIQESHPDEQPLKGLKFSPKHMPFISD